MNVYINQNYHFTPFYKQIFQIEVINLNYLNSKI